MARPEGNATGRVVQVLNDYQVRLVADYLVGEHTPVINRDRVQDVVGNGKPVLVKQCNVLVCGLPSGGDVLELAKHDVAKGAVANKVEHGNHKVAFTLLHDVVSLSLLLFRSGLRQHLVRDQSVDERS